MNMQLIETHTSDDGELRAEIYQVGQDTLKSIAGQYLVRFFVVDPGKYLEWLRCGYDLDLLRHQHALPFVTGVAFEPTTYHLARINAERAE